MNDYKKYLGDGVYFDFDGYQVVLTTSNGMVDTNIVYLEPEVLAALLKAVAELHQKLNLKPI